MELFIISLILYFGGKWLVKKTGADKPMYLCRGCKRVSRGFDYCIFCCEHGKDRPNCEQCRLEGRRRKEAFDAEAVVGEYQAPESHWAPQSA